MGSMQRGPETLITPEATALSVQYADIGSRGVAIFLDSLIQLVTIGIVALFINPDRMGDIGNVVMIIVSTLVFFGYFILFEGLLGRTPGKMATKLRVLTITGQPITMGMSTIRNFIRVVDYLPTLYLVGIVSIALTRKDQRLGDLAAATVVVVQRPVIPPTPLWLPSPPQGTISLDVSTLDQGQYEVVRTFLQRRTTLDPTIRLQIASQIASAVKPTVAGGASWPPRLGDELFLEHVARTMQERAGIPTPTQPPGTWVPPPRS